MNFAKTAFLSGCRVLLAAICFLLINQFAKAQMRQVYVDPFTNNSIEKISFYSPAAGFAAFENNLAFSSDSGHTFTTKLIGNANTNANGYLINTVAGFWINGVKAFDQNNLFVYGDYGLVPAILQSSDGGNSFIVRYYSQFNSQLLRTGITDMIFPQNSTTGFAIDADRVLKTTNGGISWNAVRTDPDSYFDELQAVDNNIVFAMCTQYQYNKVLRTLNGGTTWAAMPLPLSSAFKVSSMFFLDGNTGWVNMHGSNNDYYVYKTVNAGSSWTLQNNILATGFDGAKMHFTDANSGYALSGQNTVYKTLNSGAIWERLPRDNSYAYLGYTHNDLQVLSAAQLWAGGGHGLLELSINGGGTPIPGAYFLADTLGVAATGIVHLNNYSRTGYSYKWFVNNSQVSTSYNSQYSHAPASYLDSVKLVVSNGSTSDSLTRYLYFNVPAPPLPAISSFSPTYGQKNSVITITGTNFIGVSAVKFGGTNAISYTVVSPTTITAVLDSLGTGNVDVTTPFGTGTKPGFTSLTPIVTSFSPASGGPGTMITILGLNIYGAISGMHVVKFGGTAAASISIFGDGGLNASVGSGASGNITYQTDYGTATIAGFTFIPPPHITSFTPSQADQGGTVTITGTNFTGTTAVKFGSLPAASFTVNSPTSVTATVAAGFSGKVYLTTPSGTDSLAGFVYTTPIITTFAPATGGSGTIVEITGTDLDAVTSVSFGGTAAASFTVNSATSITAIVGSGTSGNVMVAGIHGTVSKTGFLYTSVPFITGFSPAGGPVGTTVTIHGSNFSSTPANNIVYFGAVKALVTAATTSTLTVTAPAFANYEYLTVTVNGLTASSTQSFTLTFPGGVLTGNTYSTAVNLASKKSPGNTVLSDLDGDGKTDIMLRSLDTLSYFLNTGSGGTLSFAPRVDILMPNMSNDIKSADFNGDGKKDIFVVLGGVINVIMNSSSPGAVSFAAPASTGVPASGIPGYAVGDVTGDGKPDIVLASSGINVFRNTSAGAVISFDPQVYLPALHNDSPWSVCLGDYDGDGKTDIAVANKYQNGSSTTTAISVFRNTYTNGAVSFAQDKTFGVPGWYADIHTGDLDNDGKPDLIYTILGYYSASGNTLTQTTTAGILRNTSVAGNISFGLPQTASAANGPWGLALGDADGDQKPDVAVSGNEISVTKNNSSAGAIGYGSPFFYNAASGIAMTLQMGDLNGDDKPEIVECDFNQSRIIVLVNADNAIPLAVCANANTTISSNVTGASYQWKVNTGSGFVNLVNNSNYAGVTTHDLTISNIPLSFSGYQYLCSAGPASSSITLLTVNSSAVPFVAISTAANTICSGTPVTFTAAVVNGGTAPSYQWQVNAVNAGTNSSSFTTSSLSNNDQVKVTVTSNEACVLPATAASNIITLTVNGNTAPSAAITASAGAICAGQSVTFTATAVNGGTAPAYQWQVNGINAGTNSSSFTSAVLANNDVVKLIVTSSATCSVPAAAVSNSITMNVSSNAAPSVTISTASTNICTGATVTFTAAAVNGGAVPTYQWQVNGVNAGTNSSSFTSNTISNNDVIKVILTSSAGCVTQTTATSNLITMTVGTVTPAVTISAPSTTICAGSPLTFTATAVNGGTAPSYQWQVNAVNAGTNSNVFTTSALNNGDVILVKITSNAGCVSQPGAVSNSITIQIGTVAVPVVTINASSSTACAGNNIIFTSNVSNGGSSPVYHWKKNGVLIPNATQPSYTGNNFISGDVVSVEVTGSGNCASLLPVSSNNIAVNIVTAPVLIISGNISVLEGTSAFITASVQNGFFQWQDSTPAHNWQNIPNATAYALNYIPAASGVKLRCKLNANAGCTSISNTLIFTTEPATGDPLLPNNGIVSYPNPVADFVIVDRLRFYDQWSEMEIISASGNTITTDKTILGKTKLKINVSGLSAGIYFIKLTRKTGDAAYLKFVKM